MKFFIDSNIIIETLKGNKVAVEIIKNLFENRNIIDLYINPTVFSECVYQLHYKKNLS